MIRKRKRTLAFILSVAMLITAIVWPETTVDAKDTMEALETEYNIVISNPSDSGIIYVAEAGNGAVTQHCTTNGFKSVVYRAASGYYFPDNYVYKVKTQNGNDLKGLEVVRDSYS